LHVNGIDFSSMIVNGMTQDEQKIKRKIDLCFNLSSVIMSITQVCAKHMIE